MATFPGSLHPDARTRIEDSFGRQTIMRTLGADIVDLAPGRVVLALPFRSDLCQQHGYLHAGALTTVVDSACGYAALSLMPAGREVLTVDFTVNFLAPAAAESFRAEGTVLRAGRTLMVCRGEVYGSREREADRLICAMQATMTAVDGDR